MRFGMALPVLLTLVAWLASCGLAHAGDVPARDTSAVAVHEPAPAHYGSREARANGSYEHDPMVWVGYAIVLLVGWTFLPLHALWLALNGRANEIPELADNEHFSGRASGL